MTPGRLVPRGRAFDAADEAFHEGNTVKWAREMQRARELVADAVRVPEQSEGAARSGTLTKFGGKHDHPREVMSELRQWFTAAVDERLPVAPLLYWTRRSPPGCPMGCSTGQW